MKPMLVVMVAGLVSALGASAALAEKFELQRKYTREEVFNACAGAGGEIVIQGPAYGCVKKDCDGQGGLCNVECHDRHGCTGTTPSRTAAGRNLRGLSNVLGGGVGRRPSVKAD